MIQKRYFLAPAGVVLIVAAFPIQAINSSVWGYDRAFAEAGFLAFIGGLGLIGFALRYEIATIWWTILIALRLADHVPEEDR